MKPITFKRCIYIKVVEYILTECYIIQIYVKARLGSSLYCGVTFVKVLKVYSKTTVNIIIVPVCKTVMNKSFP